MAIQKYKGHLALLGAAIMWGLMSPIGKTALENGISGLSLATFRMTGGAIARHRKKPQHHQSVS